MVAANIIDSSFCKYYYSNVLLCVVVRCKLFLTKSCSYFIKLINFIVFCLKFNSYKYFLINFYLTFFFFSKILFLAE